MEFAMLVFGYILGSITMFGSAYIYMNECRKKAPSDASQNSADRK